MNLRDLRGKKRGGITHPGSFNKSFLCLACRALSKQVFSLKRQASPCYDCWSSINVIPFWHLLHHNSAAKGETQKDRMDHYWKKSAYFCRPLGVESSTHGHGWAELCGMTEVRPQNAFYTRFQHFFSWLVPLLVCRHSQTICTYHSDGRKPRHLTSCILVHKLCSITAVKVCPDTRTFAPQGPERLRTDAAVKASLDADQSTFDTPNYQWGGNHHLLPSHSILLLTCGTKADPQLLSAGQVFDIVISQLFCVNKMTHVEKTKRHI